MKLVLETITAEIHVCMIEQDRAGARAAVLILEAKEQCFPDSLAWLAWCLKEFGFGRRHSFRLACIGDLVRSIPDLATKISARGGTNYHKIEEIAQIPTVAQVLQFLKKHDVSGMDREELREAVRAFLGKTPVEKQLTFLFYEKMPTPEQLTAGLDNPKFVSQIDLKRETQFITGHLQRIAAIEDRSDPEELLKLAKWFRKHADVIQSELQHRKEQA